MLTTLMAEFSYAAGTAPRPVDAPLTSLVIWGYSLQEILKLVMSKALDLGREYRSDIEQAAKSAVDRLVALDLPYIPDSVEGVIDEATRNRGYAAIEKVLDAILAEQAIS
jgi:hypothetical protein